MQLDNISTFDELYAVSDIHMGGETGFQILKHGPRLGALIEKLAEVRPDADIALILNGDIIDSLAEDIDGFIAMEEAGQMMDRVYGDPAFRPVWDGLSTFVSTPNRHLVFVLGNHDIELSLPHVEKSVRDRLAGDDLAKNARVVFATHGAGFGCRVGKARVFCTHGNEVDDWNVVDHDRLGQLGNALNAGRSIERSKWQPNAGTRLVVQVMNKIKARYPFVDLLKPETKAVLSVLMVMAPDLVRSLKFEDITSIVKGKIRGSLVTRGLLSAEAESVDEALDIEAATEIAIPELLGQELRQELDAAATGNTSGLSADDLLQQVESDFAAGKRAIEVERRQAQDETLGVIGMIVDRIRGVDKIEALRKALIDWLKDDTTFDLSHRDETCTEIVKRVGPDVDFIITGHTHLERAIQMDDGVERYYYNCGTWIRLIRFTNFLLHKPAAFKKVFETLELGSMEAIDKMVIPAARKKTQPLVLDKTAFVHISSNGDEVTGSLNRVTSNDDGSALKWNIVAGSEYRVS